MKSICDLTKSDLDVSLGLFCPQRFAEEKCE